MVKSKPDSVSGEENRRKGVVTLIHQRQVLRHLQAGGNSKISLSFNKSAILDGTRLAFGADSEFFKLQKTSVRDANDAESLLSLCSASIESAVLEGGRGEQLELLDVLEKLRLDLIAYRVELESGGFRPNIRAWDRLVENKLGGSIKEAAHECLKEFKDNLSYFNQGGDNSHIGRRVIFIDQWIDCICKNGVSKILETTSVSQSVRTIDAESFGLASPISKKLSLDEEAALLILKLLQEADQNELSEQIADGQWTLTYKKETVKESIRVKNYIAGRIFSLQHKWIAELGGLISPTMLGVDALKRYEAGRYQKPIEAGKELEQFKSFFLRNKIIAATVVIFCGLVFLVNSANQISDAISKIHQHKSESPGSITQAPSKESSPLPDVELVLTNTSSPTLIIKNKSKVLAREIKWYFALWNMAHLQQPLPIPIQTFDWIKAGESSGPLRILPETVSNALHEGDIVFGSMAESCPECERGRTYFLVIDWQRDGWYCEIEKEKSGDLFIPKPATPVELRKFYSSLIKMPKSSRKPILAP